MSEERKCKECKHFKIVSHSYVMGKERFPIWSCEKWNCEFEKGWNCEFEKGDSNEDNN